MSNETTPGLKVCPFCGGSAHCTFVSDFRITSPRTGRRATCDQCPASSGAYGTEFEAVRAWNTRAPAESLIATLRAELQEQALQYLSDNGQWIEETGRLRAELAAMKASQAVDVERAMGLADEMASLKSWDTKEFQAARESLRAELAKRGTM